MSKPGAEPAEKPVPALSLRLRKAAALVTRGNRAADVGCDHGYLSIYLYRKGICPHCIAMDINAGPLAAAKENIARYGAGEGVETRLSDGLRALKAGECESILLTGMGGRLMGKILEEGREVLRTVKEVVAEPQSEAGFVRAFLCTNGFAVMAEDMVRERGKYYPLLRAERMDHVPVLSAAQLTYGPCLIQGKNPLLAEFLAKEKKRLYAIRGELSGRAGMAGLARRAEIAQELGLIKEVENRWNAEN